MVSSVNLQFQCMLKCVCVGFMTCVLTLHDVSMCERNILGGSQHNIKIFDLQHFFSCLNKVFDDYRFVLSSTVFWF